jgi:hypothetical protein
MALLIAWVAYAAAPTDAPMNAGLLAVWDMETPVFNAVGGSYNAYGSDGCDVVPQRTSLVHRGPSGHALKISYNNLKGASCGLWIHLFREGSPPGSADFPDMTRFPYLSFWIKDGGKPQDVDVRMADAAWLSRDDSKIAGRAARYLGQQSRDGWREVVVPFRDFQLPTSKAAVVALQFAPGTSGVLYVDDICFKSSAELESGYSGTPAVTTRVTRRRATWLWETSKLLENPGAQAGALATLREAGVTDLFLQVPRHKGELDRTQVQFQAELRGFIRTLHAHAIRVHALDGYPEFSLREEHQTVLSLVRNVIAYNSASAPEERFDGVHLDDEPYQLLGFEGPIREEILREYLELNEKVAALVQRETPGLAFGVDIPFWWDEAGDSVEFNGVRKSAAQQIIDLTDNVGIMAYRNFAGGMDGIVNHAQANVDHAGARGKQAFVAVETYRSPPITVTFVAAIREAQWQALPAKSSLLRLSHLRGYPLRGFTDGLHHYIGIADDHAGTVQTTYATAVGTLRLSLPGNATDWISDLRPFQGSVERYGRSSGEWRGANVLPAGNALSVMENMPSKITLAGKTSGFVDEILQEVGDAFAKNRGFTGDAIHSLESYQELRSR